jgi:prolyl-tRNA synthetase
VKDATLVAASEKIASELEAAGYDVLLDDRDERPGVKFKDADLVGIPYRINIGKLLAEGKMEVVERAKAQKIEVAVDDVLTHLQGLYNPRA